MTELEQIIYECALSILPEVKEKVKVFLTQVKPDIKFIEIPFYCEGVFDYLIYDIELNRFTKIKYSKGVGKGTVLEGMSKYAAYYDNTELKEIPIDL